ncbi:MAG: glycosyltransferase family 2 protein [Candidatus Binataceae bacterium]
MAAAIASDTASAMPRAGAAPQAAASSLGREIFYTRLAIALSVITSTIALIGLGHIVVARLRSSQEMLAAVDAFFAANIAFLMYGSLFYQFTRHAYLIRMTTHRKATREELESIYDRELSSALTVLVPSYCEELRVIRMTLMSAALMEYPGRHVVLLIDNPPNPSDPLAAKELAATRELTRKLDTMFRALERRYATELAAFERRQAAGPMNISAECGHIANLYHEIAAWMEKQADGHEMIDHYDALFVNRVLLEPATAYRARAAEMDEFGASDARPSARIAREYKRIAVLFAAQLSSFERKRFVNLSHASNKAMNLNSYLGLIGRNFRELIGPGGLYLEECDREHADLRIRHADYVITLDADSMLLHDYALRLTHIMDQPDAAQYAVVQSPFSAVQGATSVLERVAGAQTDVQWYGTQGCTLYNGSFWVGANALLRRAALEDIRETEYERGFPITRYIHDRTLVEDTESTIDLVVNGWKVFCYPERLSFSATPPDFGALVIQRRRWANGPLLIVPKLLRYAFGSPGRIRRLPEAVLRLYSLSSVAAAFSMLLLTCTTFPDTKRLPMAWLMLSAVPYYAVYCRDLQASGYKWWDLPRVYSMNLLLMPVNLAGVLKSIRQAITGERSVFARTPKVPGRTAAPSVHIIMPILILACVLISTLHTVDRAGWGFGAYGLLNTFCIGYAIVSYIGVRAGLEDLGASFAMKTETWTERLRAQSAGTARPEMEFARRDISERVSAEAGR